MVPPSSSLSRQGTEGWISFGSYPRTITENTRACARSSAFPCVSLNRRDLGSWIIAVCLKHQPLRDLPRSGWSKLLAVLHFLWTANASHGSEVAVFLAANIVFQTDIVAQSVDEARAEILRVVIGIMNGDVIFELVRTGLTKAFGGDHHVRMRRAGRVQERLLVEAGRLNDERIAFEMADGVAVVEGEG